MKRFLSLAFGFGLICPDPHAYMNAMIHMSDVAREGAKQPDAKSAWSYLDEHGAPILQHYDCEWAGIERDATKHPTDAPLHRDGGDKDDGT